ncbi:aminopeptidase [Camelliibacillus cellulosilyticus]|uniref:Aminopeptidase n=1 Tax=Camelliibacillus cellulosilyticus TaxID=2174486 RepID=A0ABV9GTB5_9BACL
MSLDFEKKLDQYAELVVKVGVNLHKGQKLLILAPIEAADFTRRIVKCAYKNGCSRVVVDWRDTPTSRIHIEEAPEETLKSIPQWDINRFKSFVDDHDCVINLLSDDPKAFEGVDPKRLMMMSRAQGEHLGFFQDAKLTSHIHWTIIGVPTAAWATAVFPGKSEPDAIAALWEAIFRATRIDQVDPIQNWHDHDKQLKEKVEKLNAYHFKTLHYKSAKTDLSIDLHPDHIWVGGSMHSTIGHTYIVNMPTEEVFTAALKTGVNGTVASTKPLSAMGNLIENFSMTFENGKVVSFQAEKGEEALRQLLEIDDGMKFIGEVALVPHDSPISNTGITFMNTLYDENASCHLAIGAAIIDNVKDAKGLSKEALDEKGINQSKGHIDFMIGSDDLDIDGETAQGERIPVFRDGNWTI